MSYEELERQVDKPTRQLADWTERWNKLRPLGEVNGALLERLEHFASERHLTLADLEALDTRVDLRGKGPEILLAWGHHALVGGRQVITALKFRNIGNGEREALRPSVFLRPILIGNQDSLDVFVAEGETDAARLHGLIGDVGLVLMLPAGALTWKREWENYLPRGATVHLCHDADDSGDAGAAKMVGMVAGTTVRVRPPDGYKDWCAWGGDRTAFLQLVGEARAAEETPMLFLGMDDFLSRTYPAPEALLGDFDSILYLARGTFLLVYGDGGAGKSTWTVDAIAHLAAGREWLDISVARPVRILMIENEGSAGLFQAKLAAKMRDWRVPETWAPNVTVYAEPWSRFSFADPHMRLEIRNVCHEKSIDLIVANPLFGVGGPGAGKPEETGLFVEWLKELGMWSDGPAVWLLHHQNKLGQVSGDWIRQPDTVVMLERDSDQPRTLVTWEKVRWTNQEPEGWKRKVLLSWDPSHKGYEVMDVDLAGVTDSQLAGRLDVYLEEHPWSTTTTITTNVKGARKRLIELLKEGAESHRYQSEKGARGATLYALAQQQPLDPFFGGGTGKNSDAQSSMDTGVDPFLAPRTQTESTPEGVTDPFLVPPYREERVEERTQTNGNEEPDSDGDIPF